MLTFYATRRIKIGDSIFGRGDELPDELVEEISEADPLRFKRMVRNGMITDEARPRLRPSPHRGSALAATAAALLDGGDAGDAPTDDVTDAQAASEEVSNSDEELEEETEEPEEEIEDSEDSENGLPEFPKRVGESSWYELSNGLKVQGYDEAVEAESEL